MSKELKKNIKIQNSNISDFFVEKIKEYIQSNLNSQLSLNSVAAYFKISPGHLSRIFKEYSGINFVDFLVKSKLEKCTELIVADKKLEISKIADMMGYSNPSYFIKLFKNNYGITPIQYRKKHS